MTHYAGPIRFRGNSPSARQYEHAGRKLLGELEVRCKQQGVEVLSLRRTLPDGTQVIASRHGSQRRVQVIARTPGDQKAPRMAVAYLEGFVPWPMGGSYAVREFPEVVLIPDDNDYIVSAYGVEQLPEGVDGEPYYAPIYPEGILRAGNVDWTNASESLSVTWYGPRTRYLEPTGLGIDAAYGSARTSLVFCHGQLLADISTEPFATLLGTDAAMVAGAALRKTATGLELLIAATLIDDSDFLLAVRVIGGATTAVLRTDVDEEGGSETARLLWTRVQEEDDNLQHPFFFNAAATQARCIRNDSANDRRVELILSLDDDTATFDVAFHPYPVTTSVATLDSSIALIEAERESTLAGWTYTPGVGAGADGYAVDADLQVLPRYVPDPAATWDTVDDEYTLEPCSLFADSAMGGGVTGDGNAYVHAVDFKPDGTVVYLREYPQEESNSGTASSGYAFGALSDTLSITSMADTLDASHTVDVSATGSMIREVEQTLEWSNSQSLSTRITYGADEEFEALITGGSVATQTGSSLNQLSDTFSHSWNGPRGHPSLASGPLEWDVVDAMASFGDRFSYGASATISGSPDPVRLWASATVDSATADRSLQLSGSCSASGTDRALLLVHADLRNDLLVYIEDTASYVTSGSYSHTATFSDPAFTGGNSYTHSLPASSDVTKSHTMWTVRAGEVMHVRAYETGSATLSGSNPVVQSIGAFANAIFFLTPGTDCCPALPDDLFGIDAFSFARTGLKFNGTTPPEAGPLEEVLSSDAIPSDRPAATLYGQIGALTLFGWPLSDSTEDADGFRTYGSWAFYRNRACFSFLAPEDGFLAGWRTILTGSNFGVPKRDATALLGTHVRQHPIWVLPKVAPVRRELPP